VPNSIISLSGVNSTKRKIARYDFVLMRYRDRSLTRRAAYLVRDTSISQELCIHDEETVLSAAVRESRIDAKSLLFKYLADRVGISSSLVFLPSCRTRAGLNFVHLPSDSGRILVDLVRPSTLFDSVKHSDLVSKYMDSPIVIEDKLIQSCCTSKSSNFHTFLGPTFLYNVILDTVEGENRRNDRLRSGLEILCDLSVSHVSIGDQIGSGQFAKVHRGKIGPFPCACKVINTSEMPVAQLNQLFEREIPILRLCQNHPSILQLIGVDRRPGSIVILSELCSSSLYDLIQTLKKQRNPLDDGPSPGFSLVDVIFVARSLLSALSHLSNHNIAHRDLKSHNILLNVRPPSEAASTVGSRGTASMILECKLADFGLAKQIKQGKLSLRKSVGSRRWMAPEVQSGETPYNTTCDIWSLGLILVEMITLDLPFPSLNALDIKAAVLGGSAVCYDPDSVLRHRPDLGPVIDIIQQCLIADPASRPTASQLLQSPIFSQHNTE
jgi:hypothetical protein